MREPNAVPAVLWGQRKEIDAGLPWSGVVERLASARNYWVATVRPDGRPHVTPVWGVWLDGAFYFSTGTRSRKARNIAANPNVAVHLDGGEEVVSLEGRVEEVTEAATLARFKAAYDPKYEWDMTVDQGGIYVVRPRRVLAFSEYGCGERATRWTLEEASS